MNWGNVTVYDSALDEIMFEGYTYDIKIKATDYGDCIKFEVVVDNEWTGTSYVYLDTSQGQVTGWNGYDLSIEAYGREISEQSDGYYHLNLYEFLDCLITLVFEQN